MGYKAGDFPVTEKTAREIVSLPMFPQLTREQHGRVINEMLAFAEMAEEQAA